jgi:sigma-B regulation protein RsbU (phosphoserine phosphatase)
VNAGHNYPIICGNGNYTELKEGGLLLGVIPGGKYKVGHIEMNAGELIALYSDGITEAINGNNAEYGEDRLIKLLNKHCRLKASEILDAVIRDVQAYCGTPQDDVTLMVIKKT